MSIRKQRSSRRTHARAYILVKTIKVSPSDINMSGAKALSWDLAGVIFDLEHNGGIADEVIMKTLHRVHELLSNAKQVEPTVQERPAGELPEVRG